VKLRRYDYVSCISKASLSLGIGQTARYDETCNISRSNGNMHTDRYPE
jgi:hypothetical protein